MKRALTVLFPRPFWPASRPPSRATWSRRTTPSWRATSCPPRPRRDSGSRRDNPSSGPDQESGSRHHQEPENQRSKHLKRQTLKTPSKTPRSQFLLRNDILEIGRPQTSGFRRKNNYNVTTRPEKKAARFQVTLHKAGKLEESNNHPPPLLPK